MFRSYQNELNKGFQMVFENGLEISVQWSKANYCSNKKDNKPSSVSAEVAVFNKDKAVTLEVLGEETIGWASPNDVSRYINIVSKHTTI